MSANGQPWWVRGVRASGGLLAALAVALSAYASHAADPAARSGLQIAAMFAFGHGLALLALGRAPVSRTALASLLLMLAGTLLFAGSLVARHLFAGSSAAAPVGGSLLILAWLLQAVSALRD